MLAELFNSLLLICGILVLLVIIYSIVVTPFNMAKKNKRKMELEKALNECLDKIAEEVIKDITEKNSKEEKPKTKRTTKKKEEK